MGEKPLMYPDWRESMRKLLILITLFLPMVAMAQQDYPRDIEYCWTLPSDYVDGTPIEAGDLASTRIVTKRTSGETILDELVPVGDVLPGGRMCHTFSGAVPQPGTYIGNAFAITVDNISSDPSNDSSKKFTGKPLPVRSYN